MKTLIAMLCTLSVIAASAGSPSKSDLDDEVRRLCAIDGGIKVYETVTLPAERFDQWGNIGVPNLKFATEKDEYYYVVDDRYYRLERPFLVRINSKIFRTSDRKILGESIRYGRGGGDHYGPWAESTFDCPSIKNAEGKLESSVFMKRIEK
ncbi:MAG: hypothetical protein KBA96_04580 [Rhodocyclaceae bacterium]|nr:hypothetical protein [Rhodocyclaceae bacterium]